MWIKLLFACSLLYLTFNVLRFWSLKLAVFPLAKDEKAGYSKADVNISKIRKLDSRSRIKILLVSVFFLAEFVFLKTGFIIFDLTGGTRHWAKISEPTSWRRWGDKTTEAERGSRRCREWVQRDDESLRKAEEREEKERSWHSWCKRWWSKRQAKWRDEGRG